MFILHGRRTARIKRYTEHQHPCPGCRSTDLEVKVFRRYYHIYFVPLFSFGPKHTEVTCRSCGSPVWIDSLNREYERKAKTPFYLYTLLILLGLLIAGGVTMNLQAQRDKARFVADPLPGDVYTIKDNSEGKSTYFFLRIAAINGDTVSLYHGNLMYDGFVTKMQDSDYFLKDEVLRMTKQELQTMLDKAEIRAVDRGYGARSGFQEIR